MIEYAHTKTQYRVIFLSFLSWVFNKRRHGITVFTLPYPKTSRHQVAVIRFKRVLDVLSKKHPDISVKQAERTSLGNAFIGLRITRNGLVES